MQNETTPIRRSEKHRHATTETQATPRRKRSTDDKENSATTKPQPPDWPAGLPWPPEPPSDPSDPYLIRPGRGSRYRPRRSRPANPSDSETPTANRSAEPPSTPNRRPAEISPYYAPSRSLPARPSWAEPETPTRRRAHFEEPATPTRRPASKHSFYPPSPSSAPQPALDPTWDSRQSLYNGEPGSGTPSRSNGHRGWGSNFASNPPVYRSRGRKYPYLWHEGSDLYNTGSAAEWEESLYIDDDDSSSDETLSLDSIYEEEYYIDEQEFYPPLPKLRRRDLEPDSRRDTYLAGIRESINADTESGLNDPYYYEIEDEVQDPEFHRANRIACKAVDAVFCFVANAKDPQAAADDIAAAIYESLQSPKGYSTSWVDSSDEDDDDHDDDEDDDDHDDDDNGDEDEDEEDVPDPDVALTGDDGRSNADRGDAKHPGLPKFREWMREKRRTARRYAQIDKELRKLSKSPAQRRFTRLLEEATSLRAGEEHDGLTRQARSGLFEEEDERIQHLKGKLGHYNNLKKANQEHYRGWMADKERASQLYEEVSQELEAMIKTVQKRGSISNEEEEQLNKLKELQSNFKSKAEADKDNKGRVSLYEEANQELETVLKTVQERGFFGEKEEEHLKKLKELQAHFKSKVKADKDHQKWVSDRVHKMWAEQDAKAEKGKGVEKKVQTVKDEDSET